MSEPKLTISCQKAYADFRLDVTEALSLSGITAIFGPSGAGKSSLLKIIAGLEAPDKGHVHFGDDIWYDTRVNIAPHKRAAGYLFQSGSLFPHLNIQKNLDFADKRSRHIDTGVTLGGVIDALDLKPLLARKPLTLSGGERQRAALGRLILSRPKILLLDEPLSGLDRARKRELLALIKTLPVQYNLPGLYVSHDIEEVTALADNLLILKDGRTQAYGAATDILNQIDILPLSDLNIDPGTVFDAHIYEITESMMRLKIGDAVISLPHQTAMRAGHKTRLKIRSQDVSIATQKPKSISIQNCLKGRIREIKAVEDTVFFDVGITLGQEPYPILKSRITRQAKDSLVLSIGQEVFALIKTASLQR